MLFYKKHKYKKRRSISAQHFFISCSWHDSLHAEAYTLAEVHFNGSPYKNKEFNSRVRIDHPSQTAIPPIVYIYIFSVMACLCTPQVIFSIIVLQYDVIKKAGPRALITFALYYGQPAYPGSRGCGLARVGGLTFLHINRPLVV